MITQSPSAERIDLPGFEHIKYEPHLKAIFLQLLEDSGELGSSFRLQLENIVLRHCGDKVDLSSAFLITEKDKIDLTIECPEVVLLIELKWDATEGRGQTELYEKVANAFYKDWKKVFLFISKNGDRPAAKAWIPVKIEPSANSAPDGMIDTALISRYNSETLSERTGIQIIAAMLGANFPTQLCERAESLTGIPHAVCFEYSTDDVALQAPHVADPGGWYPKGCGRYLRLCERTLAKTSEFYVACGDGLRLPFVMSEILVDGLELRIKYHSFAKPDKELPLIGVAKSLMLAVLRPIKPEMLLWPPERMDLHHYNFHVKQLLSRRDFERLRDQPDLLRTTVLDRAGAFYVELAEVYSQVASEFLSRRAEYS